MFHTAHGSGLPVVLLHGFPLDGRMWQAQVDALSDHYRVITPDLNGFGRSTASGPFSIDGLADEVRDYLNRIGAMECVMGGFSMGGYVALAYAKKYAADMRGLLLIDTKSEGDTAEGKAGRAKMIELARTSGSKAVAEQMLPKMLTATTITQNADLVKSVRELMESQSPRTIEHALAAMRDRPDRTSELSDIQVPTLILVGDQDPVTPPAVARSMSEKIRGSKLVEIKGAAHLSPMEQPEQVNAALRQFLAESLK